MTAAPEVKAVAYDGPQCPWCERRLPPEAIHSGLLRCPSCNAAFEATAFHPPPLKLQVVETAHSGPEAVNACANHPLNTAVTTCQRCGIFICSLCDMNVGSGSHCPTCFDRLRTEGSLQGATTRFRDYGSMARTAAIAGFLFMFMFLGAPFGALTLYYARKGYKQRRAENRPTAGVRVAAVFGLIELIAGIASIVFVIMGVAGAFK
jgi:ribosomal protein L37AE/L43A